MKLTSAAVTGYEGLCLMKMILLLKYTAFDPNCIKTIIGKTCKRIHIVEIWASFFPPATLNRDSANLVF